MKKPRVLNVKKIMELSEKLHKVGQIKKQRLEAAKVWEEGRLGYEEMACFGLDIINKPKRPICRKCGKPMRQIKDKIANKHTGYLWYCSRCFPENLGLAIV